MKITPVEIAEVLGDVEHLAPAEGAEDQHLDADRIDHRDGRRLGRGEHAGEDADQQDHLHQQRPERLAERFPFRRARIALADRSADAPRLHGDQHHEGEAEHDADDEAGGEQRGDRGAGEPAIDHEGDRRRDQQRAFGARCDQAEAEFFGKAGALEFGKGQAAHRGDGRGRGAGGGPEHHAGDHGRMPDAAAVMPDQRAEQLGELRRHAAARHQVGREHEERDRQQRDDLDTADHALPDDQVGHERVEDVLRQHRRNADNEKDLGARDQQGDGEHDEREDDHGRLA